MGNRIVLACLAGVKVFAAVITVDTPEGGAVPDVEIDSKGVMHLACVRGENAYYHQSRDLGKTWSAALRINGQPDTVHPANMFRGPDVAIGKGGRIHAIWYSNAYQRKRPTEEWGVQYGYLDPDGKVFSESRNLNNKPSDNYSLAAKEDGAVAVVWMAEKLFVTESMDNGAAFPRTETIDVADPCECCASRAAFSANGSLLIAYREKANNVRDMHLLRRTGNEYRKIKAGSFAWTIPACPMTGTFISIGTSETLMAWETKGEIFFGTTANALKGTSAAERGKWPVVLAGLDGMVLVSWKKESNLQWRLFDRNHRPISGVESKASTTSTRHTGAVTPAGDFILID